MQSNDAGPPATEPVDKGYRPDGPEEPAPTAVTGPGWAAEMQSGWTRQNNTKYAMADDNVFVAAIMGSGPVFSRQSGGGMAHMVINAVSSTNTLEEQIETDGFVLGVMGPVGMTDVRFLGSRDAVMGGLAAAIVEYEYATGPEVHRAVYHLAVDGRHAYSVGLIADDSAYGPDLLADLLAVVDTFEPRPVQP